MAERKENMTEEEARVQFWEAIERLRNWAEYGPDSIEEILEEVEEELMK